jgi:hypothetical protein
MVTIACPNCGKTAELDGVLSATDHTCPQCWVAMVQVGGSALAPQGAAKSIRIALPIVVGLAAMGVGYWLMATTTDPGPVIFWRMRLMPAFAGLTILMGFGFAVKDMVNDLWHRA